MVRAETTDVAAAMNQTAVTLNSTRALAVHHPVLARPLVETVALPKQPTIFRTISDEAVTPAAALAGRLGHRTAAIEGGGIQAVPCQPLAGILWMPTVTALPSTGTTTIRMPIANANGYPSTAPSPLQPQSDCLMAFLPVLRVRLFGVQRLRFQSAPQCAQQFVQKCPVTRVPRCKSRCQPANGWLGVT